MRGVLGFLEEYAPVMIEVKGKGYTVTHDADKRWQDADYATNNPESALMQCLNRSYLDFQPAVEDQPFNATKVIISTAIKIANRINEGVRQGDSVDYDQATRVIEMAMALTDNVKQLAVLNMALDHIAQDQALIGQLEADAHADQLQQEVVPALLALQA